MLKVLRIQNFVLIEKLELNFESGFSVITGETGSGKSILLNALNLLKGERADFSVIGNKANRSIVEAEFSVSDALLAVLEKHNLENWNHLLLRREIQKDGKSRAFVNDTPVSLVQMKEISQQLMIIHSQYNTLDLKDKNYQLSLLDELAGTTSQSLVFKKDFVNFKALTKEIESLKDRYLNLDKRQDYEQFILDELRVLELEKFNYHELSDALNQKEKRIELITLNQEILQISDTELKSQLEQINRKIDKLAVFDENLLPIKETLQAVHDHFNEIGFIANRNIDRLQDQENDDDGLLEKVDEFNRLLNKHRINNQQELLQLQLTLSGNENELLALKEQIENLEVLIQESEEKLIKESQILFDNRCNVFDSLHLDIASGLKVLKLEAATLTFELIQNDVLTENGGCDILLLFSANKGSLPVPIEKAASGGELSRVMLVLQKVISAKKNLPSILFDEVDTGVSGEVAEKMGQMLQEMGRSRQLFAITHLPQVAAQSSAHFKVQKSLVGKSTITEVVSLNLDERVSEVARLMSGEVVTQDAIQTARNLMALA